MGIQVKAQAADSRSLAAIGMSLGFAALFATMVAAFLVTTEVQALSNAPQQISLLK
jgi:hypothetical protein